MLRIAWRNRDNLPYAWKVLSRGVCDGCALGVAGLHDWTIDGVHLCMTRLNLLRLNTMPALDPAMLSDLTALQSRLHREPRTVPGQCRTVASGDALSGWDNAQLRELGRLGHPMLRERGDPGFRRISWEEANRRMAHRLRGADPRRMAFFVTARGVTNEVYYVAQKVARFLGTNHVDNAARLCHAPSTGAMKHALGYAASTCSYSDWYGTDLIIFFGSNPANDQPVTTKYLHEARRLGTRVVMVNPYLEPGMKRYWVPSAAGSALFGTGLVDWWFPVAQGGDIAFLYGVLKALIASDGIATGFIRDHTEGWEALRAACDALRIEDLEAASGLSREAMEEFATLLRGATNAVLVWSMGITQHASGGDGVSMVLNLGLARGYVGRPKNGLMPIRGHSSVQGGAEMGCYSTALPGGQPITAANCAGLSAAYGFPVPDWDGMTAVDMVEACGRGELDVFYCVGGNFLRTLPEPDAVARALSRVPFRVHQDIVLTDQMFLEPGEEVLLLPAKTRYEQDGGGIETTTERRVAFSPEIPRQVGEARAEWRILRDAAAAAWPERAGMLGCDSGQAIREEISRVVPFYAGCERLTRTGDAVQWGGARLCDDGRFATPDGRAHFKAVAVPPRERWTLRSGPAAAQPGAPQGLGEFRVSTRRGKQFNTLIYDGVDPLTGAPRDAVFINPEDARALHLAAGDRVVLENQTGRFEGVVFPVPIARGNLQVHWPEGNGIIPRGRVDAVGGVPDYNAVVRVLRG
ncbi:MAG: molybdopterin-dependent oxidoreductase [Verrucomicrobiae bacterium]|nr:molybdopterin-dependent oxidoreductase [Verrucomicrobiae bacterium]